MMKRFCITLFSLVLLFICSFIASAASLDDQPKVEMDALQSLFSSLDSQTSQEYVEQYVADNNLFMSSESGNMRRVTRLKIAFSENVAQTSRAQPGDYVTIEFDRANDQHITYASYYNYESWGVDSFNTKDPIGQEYTVRVYFDLDDFYFTGSNKSFWEEGIYYTEKNIPSDFKRSKSEEYALKYTKYENAAEAIHSISNKKSSN